MTQYRFQRLLRAVFWMFVYMVLVLAPLAVILLPQRPPGRQFWREFSVFLAFGGAAILTLQFALTARFRFMNRPFGTDIIYNFHRKISFLALGLILAHPIILFILQPFLLNWLNIFSPDTPWRARFGVLAVLLFAVLIGLSVWRKRIRFEYSSWRIWHGIFAIAAMAFAFSHMLGVGYYINTPVKRVIWVVYGVLFIGLLIYVRLIKPLVLIRHPYEVLQVSPERGESWSLTLRPTDHNGFRFQPGQFAWLSVWRTPFSDTEHPFSFSSSAENRDSFSFTIKELGDFTESVKLIQPGQIAFVDGPYGAFSTDRYPSASGYVFIAGGIGVTPIFSMLKTLVDRRDQRPLVLIYANQTWDGLTFREEIEALKDRLNLKLVYVLEDPPEGWEGEVGFVTQDILTRYLPDVEILNTYEIFICGPDPMMNAVEDSLEAMGVDLTRYHSERFDLV